jgi:uroporphyrin-III C-methyltransferase/precorrin-2 dehydrogenase/sirohydrochlorin ferrochelatase
MEYFPVFLRLQQETVLVVGGGQVALRKVQLLQRAGAHIKLVAPKVLPELSKLLTDPHRCYEREWQQTDLDGAKIVIAATSYEAINRQIHAAALARRLHVNVVDQPALCTFIIPSIVDRSPVIVAVSSSGSAPVLARLLRSRLETLIPSGYGRLAAIIGQFRQQAIDRFSTLEKRVRFWESVVQGPIAEQVFMGKEKEARKTLQAQLESSLNVMQTGEAYLVGAGPGDPDLLTFRALRLMQKADVVLYDRLIPSSILHLTRQDALKIHVGKERAKHTMPQEEISELLVRLVQEGKRVLRLKGGDPFIFGRGGEEITALANAGLPFQVVPGITAASGCAAYAGIPLTHRDYAQSVRFVTAHMKDGSCNLDWSSLVLEDQTVVFYMGLNALPQICLELMGHGCPPDRGIALIAQGTTSAQQVFISTVENLPEIVTEQSVSSPALLILGEVVKLHSVLNS